MRILTLICLFCGTVAAQEKLQLFQEQIYIARDKVLPALVHVEPIKKIYTRGERQNIQVTGSGVIFTAEGHVITNHHVASDAEKVWCTLSNKERITASVVGSDASTDIAVLRLHLEELKDKTIYPAALGRSDNLQVGQIVLALGSPLGLSRSVSMGVVSSIDRYFPDTGSMISPFNLWIQTDAAINPGNSGGPLINLLGEVVGINARAVFLAENLGFAIPINLAREVADEIILGSSVTRAWVGLDFQEIKGLRDYLEMPDLQGVLLANVIPGSPAHKAGMQTGDVLQQIGDRPLSADFEEDLPEMRKIISGLPIGETLPFRVWRNERIHQFKVTAVEEPLKDTPEFEAEIWGVVVKNLSWGVYHSQMMSDFNGVFVTSVKPGAPGEQSHLSPGDVIRTIGGEAVKNTIDFKRLYEKQLGSGKPLFIEMIRGAHPYFTVILPTATP